MTNIKGYTLIRLIAVGGMGSVYEAEQQSPKRRVALKVMKAGATSPEHLRRFEVEAQILGRLKHPGIAQIYEAGTFEAPDGTQPFFAMEYIEGMPLDDYVRERETPVRERLELLAKICDAIQHAHQKGVIHRDLKPANILVDTFGQPKILDFGVARTANQDTMMVSMHTEAGRMIGTLKYMSPEQARGTVDEIDTRTDIYAIGVMAYELISGRMPYELAGLMILSVIDAICKTEPKPLSSINRSLRGDIETIVLKAMEKEKEHRYASADDLASDIRRYLRDEPIQARPPSAWYQISKFSKRNKAVVAGAAAVGAALVLGIIGTMWQARQAEMRRAEAEAERQNAVAAKGQAEERKAQAEAARALALEREAYAQKLLYAAGIREAFSAIARKDRHFAQNLVRALRQKSADPDRPGFELLWIKRELDKVERRRLYTIKEDGKSYVTVALSPDGKTLATASFEAARPKRPSPIALRDPRTGEKLRELAGHERGIVRMAFLPDGKTLASASQDSTIKLWDAASGELRQTVGPLTGVADDLVFIDNGERLVAASGNPLSTNLPGSLQVWSVKGAPRQERSLDGITGPIIAAAVDPAGKLLAYVEGQAGAPSALGAALPIATDIVLRDLKSGAMLRRWPIRFMPFHIKFSPDGRQIWTGGMRFGVGPQGEEAGFQSMGEGAALFTPDGRMIHGQGKPVNPAERSTLAIYNPATGAEIERIDEFSKQGFWSLAHDPRSGLLIAGGLTGTICAWDLSAPPETLPTVSVPKSAASIAYSPVDDRFVAASTAPVWVYWGRETKGLAPRGADAPSEVRLYRSTPDDAPAILLSTDRDILSTGFSPDGRMIQAVVASQRDMKSPGEAIVWAADGQREILRAKGHESAILASAFSPDGKLFATAGMDRRIQVWSLETGKPLGEPIQCPGAISYIRFLQDGKRLGVLAWNPPDLFRMANEVGKIIKNDIEGQMFIYDAATREQTGRVDGTMAIRAASDPRSDSVIGAWTTSSLLRYSPQESDPEKRKADFRLGRRTFDHIFGVAYTPDGRTVALAGYSKLYARSDSEALLLDPETGESKGAIPLDRPRPLCVDFNHDGTEMAVGFEDGTIEFLNTQRGLREETK